MILRNTREPYDEVGPFDPESETGANWIEYYRGHLYVEVGSGAPRRQKLDQSPAALVGKTLSGELADVKKIVDDMDAEDEK